MLRNNAVRSFALCRIYGHWCWKSLLWINIIILACQKKTFISIMTIRASLHTFLWWSVLFCNCLATAFKWCKEGPSTKLFISSVGLFLFFKKLKTRRRMVHARSKTSSTRAISAQNFFIIKGIARCRLISGLKIRNKRWQKYKNRLFHNIKHNKFHFINKKLGYNKVIMFLPKNKYKYLP